MSKFKVGCVYKFDEGCRRIKFEILRIEIIPNNITYHIKNLEQMGEFYGLMKTFEKDSLIYDKSELDEEYILDMKLREL